MKAVALMLIAIRANAQPQALQPWLVYDGAAFDDIAGGVRRGTTYLGTLRLQLTFDGSQSGTSAFVAVLDEHGGFPVLGGRYDLNTEFYRLSRPVCRT